jgi:hypothetical protein
VRPPTLVLVSAIAGCLVAGVVESASQQPQTLPPGTASISGRVIEGHTGRPLKGANVTLNLVADNGLTLQVETPPTGVAPWPGYGPYSDRTTTNEEGMFTFARVPAGSFEVNATIPGWPVPDRRSAGADPVRWFDVRDGERLAGVEVKTYRPTIVRGRVTDEQGAPLAGIEILATAPGITPRSKESNGLVTDDQGRYSIWVQPGQNLISTVQFPSIRTTLASPPKSAFMTTFYPQASTQTDAAPIEMKRGEERDGIDFTLATRPAFRITGTVTGHDATQRMAIELLPPAPRDPRADPIAATWFGSPAAFAFATVPPGRYVVRALSTPNMPMGSHGNPPLRELPAGQTLWAEVPVTVVDRDMAVTLNLRAGARVHGRVEFDGGTPPPPFEILRDRFGGIGLVVERADGTRTDFRGALLGADRFSTIQLEPGRYVFLPWAPNPWRLKSVTHEGRDIRDYPFEIGSADIRDVVITFTDQPSTIRGQVRREPPYETTRGWVTIFPSDRALWSDYGILPRRIAFVELGRSGIFEVEVPPGTYLIAATPQSTRGRITPEALEQLAAFATTVVVGDGQTAVQDLRLRSVDRR